MVEYSVFRKFKIAFIIETILIGLLSLFIGYLVQYMHQESSFVTLSPSITFNSHTTVIPNATSKPVVNTQEPSTQNTNNQTYLEQS